MRRLVSVVLMFLVLTSSLLVSGCAAFVVTPVMGALYTSVKAPVTAGDQAVGHSKVGRASASSILGLIATGDASIDAAMRAGGITKIHHVDYEGSSILGIVATFTTIVYGE